MTPREFWNACKGYRDKDESSYKTEWERARWIGTQARNAFSQKQIKPTELLPFPWDNDERDFTEEIELLKERRKWQQQ